MRLLSLILLVAVCAVSADYSSKDDVVELTASNFQKLVVSSSEPWVVEFYAPWCGHCKALEPEYKKVATALKGIVKVGAVNMDQHQAAGAPYGIQGFPTIKFFGLNKNKAQDYNGARTAQGIADYALAEAQKIVRDRLSGKAGSSGSSSGGGGSNGSGNGGKNAVIELTDANFEGLVMKSEEAWMVEFFAPWCGHCKSLEPHWKQAAGHMEGKGVKFGAVDATVHQQLAGKFGIKGYPTIKVFAAGADKAVSDYQGGRTAKDIYEFASKIQLDTVKAPEVVELLSAEQFADTCSGSNTCVVALLPNILDSKVAGRKKFLDVLKKVAEKFKRRPFAYLWLEGGQQPDLEKAVGLGSSFPAVTAVSLKKLRYANMLLSFQEVNFSQFLQDLLGGRAQTVVMPGVPAVATKAAWDGKEGKVVVSEHDDIKMDFGAVDTDYDDSDL